LIVITTGAVVLFTVISPPRPTLEQSGNILVTHSGD
jgi:hypothetical protein